MSTACDPYDHLKVSLNPDGSLTRLRVLPEAPPNPEPAPGVPIVSKDVTVNPETKVWARIFRPTKLPSNDNTIARLPIIFYVHDGGFILFSAANLHGHNVCSCLASEIPAIIVSVDHRLAPEHRLPAQYEDAMDTILWVKQQATDPNGEEWLRSYGDFTRCYLGGRGSGANIAFHAAIRAAGLDLNPLKMSGIFMNQPMFSGNTRTTSEIEFAADAIMPLPVLDLMWELALPKGSDRDHPFCNPKSAIEKLKEEGKGALMGSCLVVGFDMDPMADRMQEFASSLAMAGVCVEARFDDFGFHNMDIVDKLSFQVVLNVIKEFVI